MLAKQDSNIPLKNNNNKNNVARADDGTPILTRRTEKY